MPAEYTVTGRAKLARTVVGGGFESDVSLADGLTPAPFAPPLFTTLSGSNSISAVVSNPYGATRYNVRIDGGATRIGSTAGGLSPSTSYNFAIQGENDTGVSEWSTPIPVSTTAVGVYAAKTDPARQFALTVDAVGGTLGTNPEASSGEIGGKYVFNSNAWYTTYSDDIQIDGQNVFKATCPAGITGEGLGGNVVLANHPGAGTPLYKGDEIWIKTKIRFPSATWLWNGGENKFFRLKYANDTTGNHVDLYLDGSRTDGSQLKWIAEQYANPLGSTVEPFSCIFPDTDHDIEMHVVLDDVSGSLGGQALQRVWVDGVLRIDGTQATLGQATANYFEAAIFKYWGNGGPPTDSTCYFKELVVQSSVPAQRDSAGNPFIGV